MVNVASLSFSFKLIFFTDCSDVDVVYRMIYLKAQKHAQFQEVPN
jgi:hypothetical protein